MEFPNMPNIVNPFLDFLDHYKPLWDFFTAIGTLGLALTALLSLIKPKNKLTITSSLVGNTVGLTITNIGDTTPVILKCVWRSKKDYAEFDRLRLTINGLTIGINAPRLINGDVLQAWMTIDEIATQACSSLPDSITGEELEKLVRSSTLACFTANGDSFKTPLTQEMISLLTTRINTIKTTL